MIVTAPAGAACSEAIGAESPFLVFAKGVRPLQEP